mmetsp:Transcript_46868/g.92246  ORF Transcript_46868/g.92246 Transcript_46868/m.92246 type:complete len:591 (+) Transcript_46868:29-1801(+)|eukprot:CAMPEP_0175130876 /NCGR_PEP_ID=MMETSP0087-20121206/6235_1 /TAXON_ID=136419 /ORGANISM="Unknown Unknown, Strain D1" /LENGTH=590 /DNA_ID=CAMNT_0016413113 /DNA_START=29 /DNA_END=1801 /DNA_ORIENTATION=-
MSLRIAQNETKEEEISGNQVSGSANYVAPNTSLTHYPAISVQLSGTRLLRTARYNKGLAFTAEERRLLRLEGLLPPAVLTQEIQVNRVLEALSKKDNDLEKHIALIALCGRNERLFFRVLTEKVETMMPLVYTPTVGLACQKFGHIYREPRGLYISLHHLGRVRQVLESWPYPVTAIVFTDGERILGLGDLGTYGMGIPIGKLFLYTACGGVSPEGCLPVCLDTGTNNKSLLADDMYTGLQQERERGPKYDALIEEFIVACMDRWGETVLLQFEDFANQNAFRLLEKYRNRCCCFNDDIQGTASVVLGGLYAGCKALGKPMKEHVFLFYGAGSAGIGIANLIAYAISNDDGVSVEQARKNIHLIDSRGLIYAGRESGGISGEKLQFAHSTYQVKSAALEDIINVVQPTAIIGVAAQAGAFTEAGVRAMHSHCKNPLIFALSNPTSKAECTAEQAYSWTDGQCYFASGSPFDPVTLPDGQKRVPGQGNNSFIFPGVGLAVVASKATRVTDKMFYIAAKALGDLVTEEDIKVGLLYPSVSRIRAVSVVIAVKVATLIFQEDLSTLKTPKDIDAFVRSQIYDPKYPLYVPAAE